MHLLTALAGPRVQGCSSAWLLSSPNLASAADAADVKWELLPEGDEGLHATSGAVAEEGDTVALRGGGLYMVIRTNNSRISVARSVDSGASAPRGTKSAHAGACV